MTPKQERRELGNYDKPTDKPRPYGAAWSPKLKSSTDADDTARPL